MKNLTATEQLLEHLIVSLSETNKNVYHDINMFIYYNYEHNAEKSRMNKLINKIKNHIYQDNNKSVTSLDK